jgi:hypothetical protein
MKILTNKMDYNMVAISSAAEASNIDFKYWSEKDRPAFDIFDDFKPDIFIWNTNNTSRALLKCIKETDAKIVAVDTNTKGGDFLELKLDGKIAAMCSDEPVADLVNFSNRLEKPELASKFLIITDWLGDVDVLKVIDESGLHACDIKMFGVKHVKHPSYLGAVLPKDYKYFITVAENTWCIPHSTQQLNVFAANGYTSFTEEGNEPWSKSTLKMGKLISRELTSFHRLASVLTDCDEPELAKTVLTKMDKYK